MDGAHNNKSDHGWERMDGLVGSFLNAFLSLSAPL